MSDNEHFLYYLNEYGERVSYKIPKASNSPLKLYRFEELEVIDFGDGNFTVLWAGLHYGVGPLETVVKGKTLTAIREKIANQQYELVDSVKSALEKHYK